MFFLLLFHQLLFHSQVNAQNEHRTHSVRRFEFINFIKIQDDQLFGEKTTSSEDDERNIPDLSSQHTAQRQANPHLNSTNTAYIRTVQAGKQQQLHVDLISFGNQFSMILFPSLQFPVVAKHRNQTEHLTVTCYTGFLRNSPANSELFAYFHNHILNAVISAFDDVYHIEQLENQTVIMYRESDLDLSDYKYFDLAKSNDAPTSEDKQQNLIELPVFPMHRPNKRSLLFANQAPLYPNRPSVCDVELIADHTFAEQFNHDKVRISSELFLMLMYVNSIFSQTDFNMDGRPDGVIVQLARIVIYHTQDEKGYTWSDTTLDPYQVLNQIGFRVQTHCLSLSVIHRDFSEFTIYKGILGLAWLSEPNNHQGICSKATINQRVSASQMWMGNTGFITNFSTGKTRTRAEASSTLAHEIGHSFGTNHDDHEKVIAQIGKCPPIFLMSAVDHSLETKKQFSQCSKMQIDPVLRTRSTCFRPYEPRCGNGFKEYGEGDYLLC